MAKYYTPTIDEFHDGFRFEWKIKDSDDYKTINHVHGGRLPEDLLNTRVKYLDFDDIIELGFTYEEKDGDTDLFYKIFSLNSDIASLGLEYVNGLPIVTIWKDQNGNSNWDFIVKQLHIKNINELEWILNRYGI